MLSFTLDKRTRHISVNGRGFVTQPPTEIIETPIVPENPETPEVQNATMTSGKITFNISHLSRMAFELFSEDEIGMRVKENVLSELAISVKQKTDHDIAIMSDNATVLVLSDTLMEVTKEEDGKIVPDIEKSTERYNKTFTLIQTILDDAFAIVRKYDAMEWFSTQKGINNSKTLNIPDREEEYTG